MRNQNNYKRKLGAAAPDATGFHWRGQPLTHIAIGEGSGPQRRQHWRSHLKSSLSAISRQR